jgi:hypothetical protein
MLETARAWNSGKLGKEVKGVTSSAENIGKEHLFMCKEVHRLLTENEYLDDLVGLARDANGRNNLFVSTRVQGVVSGG